MTKYRLFTGLMGIIIMVCLLGAEGQMQMQTFSNSNSSWKNVEQVMGRSGIMMPDDVFSFYIPRTDLNVKIGNVALEPALALDSWIAFKKMGNESMVMGDLVLKEDEVNKVMLKLQQEGLEQTALHNQLLGESPNIMHLHIMGRGDPVAMAGVIRDALALIKTSAKVSTITKPMNESLDTAMLDAAIGVNGKYNDNVYQFDVLRKERITEEGMELTPSLDVATEINFQPLGGGNAAVAGEFVLMAKELNPVIRALRENNINVTAIHNHMIYEEPRLIFLHIWATGGQNKLAIGLKEALDKTNSSR